MSQNVDQSKKKVGANIALNFALIFLCIHLFTVNSRLIHHMNPDGLTSGNVFDFMNLGVENVIAMVISISYSVMTVIIIKSLQMPFRDIWNFAIIGFYGVLDGIGVGLYYLVMDNFKLWGSLYFGIYTFAIIVSFGLYQSFEPKNPKDELNEIRKLIYRRKAQLKRDPELMKTDEKLLELEERLKYVDI